MENGAEDCQSCQEGFYMSAPASEDTVSTCKHNECTCPNGHQTVSTGRGPTLCETDGTIDCFTCIDGYSLSSDAGPGLQTCKPATCSSSGLPVGPEFYSSECSGLKVEQYCHVSCADGYTGTDSVYTCDKDGTMKGTAPQCQADKCDGKKHTGNMFPAHTGSNCHDVALGESCKAYCTKGYSGTNQTRNCTDKGFTGAAIKCEPDPCDVPGPPANGGMGDCESTLKDHASCTPTCNAGYHLHGKTTCDAGDLHPATCDENTCSEIEPPSNGAIGNCSGTIASGVKCQPTCNSGYKVSGMITCDHGHPTEVTCDATYNCPLVYARRCHDFKGYWTDDDAFLDYPGCERYCNMKGIQTDGKITGCELSNVPAATRDSKGKMCFAHVKPCTIGLAWLGGNAAAVCTHYSEQ
jgi:hypothetical protein